MNPEQAIFLVYYFNYHSFICICIFYFTFMLYILFKVLIYNTIFINSKYSIIRFFQKSFYFYYFITFYIILINLLHYIFLYFYMVTFNFYPTEITFDLMIGTVAGRSNFIFSVIGVLYLFFKIIYHYFLNYISLWEAFLFECFNILKLFIKIDFFFKSTSALLVLNFPGLLFKSNILVVKPNTKYYAINKKEQFYLFYKQFLLLIYQIFLIGIFLLFFFNMCSVYYFHTLLLFLPFYNNKLIIILGFVLLYFFYIYFYKPISLRTLLYLTNFSKFINSNLKYNLLYRNLKYFFKPNSSYKQFFTKLSNSYFIKNAKDFFYFVSDGGKEYSLPYYTSKKIIETSTHNYKVFPAHLFKFYLPNFGSLINKILNKNNPKWIYHFGSVFTFLTFLFQITGIFEKDKEKFPESMPLNFPDLSTNYFKNLYLYSNFLLNIYLLNCKNWVDGPYNKFVIDYSNYFNFMTYLFLHKYRLNFYKFYKFYNKFVIPLIILLILTVLMLNFNVFFDINAFFNFNINNFTIEYKVNKFVNIIILNKKHMYIFTHIDLLYLILKLFIFNWLINFLLRLETLAVIYLPALYLEFSRFKEYGFSSSNSYIIIIYKVLNFFRKF